MATTVLQIYLNDNQLLALQHLAAENGSGASDAHFAQYLLTQQLDRVYAKQKRAATEARFLDDEELEAKIAAMKKLQTERAEAAKNPPAPVEPPAEPPKGDPA